MTTVYCSRANNKTQRSVNTVSAKTLRRGLSVYERHGEATVKALANSTIERFPGHEVVMCNVLALSNPLANVEEILRIVQKRLSVASRVLSGAEILRPEERPVLFACPDVKFFKRLPRERSARVRVGLHWNVAYLLHKRALLRDPDYTRAIPLIEKVCSSLPDTLGASFAPLRFRRENATVSQMAAYSRNHCYSRDGYLVESHEEAEHAAQLFSRDWLLIAPTGV